MTEQKKHLYYAGQAITTRYLGPTNRRGTRIAAMTRGSWPQDGGRVVIPYRHDLSGGAEGAHYAAVLELVRVAGLSDKWRDIGRVGCTETGDGRGYIYFLLPAGE